MSNLNTYTTPGNWKRGLTRADSGEKIFGNQFSLQGNFATGKIKHQVFTGMDFEYSTTPNYTFGFFDPAKPADLVTTEKNEINLFNYDYSTQSRDVPFQSRITQLATTNTQRFGIYAQDLISLTEKLKVFAGIRWSWQEAEVTTKKEIIKKDPKTNENIIDLTFNEAKSNSDPKIFNRAFSPKGGIVFQPNKEIALFGSYSNSFTPNTGNDINGKALKPSIIDQFESGIKTELNNGKITTNFTVYLIKNNNLAQTAPFLADGITPNVNTNIKELVGGTTAKGIEIDITLKPIENLNINAGYSYNDTRITKTQHTNGSLIEGDRLVRTPQNTANLSFFYKVKSGKLKGLSIGAIGNYVGDRLGGWNDRYVWKEVTPATNPKTYTISIEDRDIPINGYTTVDASLGYDFGNISILCKVSNITNELNYTVHENYSVNPIAPRQIMTTLKYKF
jgi:iron complex outermembrane receptor protein